MKVAKVTDMKQKIKFLLPLIALSLVGCSPISILDRNNSSSIEIKDSEIKSISLNVTADYGNFVQRQVTLLYNGILPFFNLQDYGYSTKVYAGCMIDIKYKGKFIVRETYPATCDENLLEIVDIKVSYGRVIEYTVSGYDLIPVDEIYQEYNVFEEEWVIKEDNTFGETYSFYPDGTRIYGINPAYYNSSTICALYSYDVLNFALI